jgi:hypothetical protein
MTSILNYLRGHLTLSSALAVVLTVISVTLASGLIGPDTAFYHALGYVSAVIVALGFKAYQPADKPSA